MIYKTPYDTQYHFKKGMPMVGVFLFLIFMQWMIYGSGLMAGETLFKECKNCGHWNYQFSNTCSMCGETGRFEDVWLKPDCEKRDAKKKKKCISKSVKSMPDDYENFISPIECIIYMLHYESNPKAKDTIVLLLQAREDLIKLHGLEDYAEWLYRISNTYDHPTLP